MSTPSMGGSRKESIFRFLQIDSEIDSFHPFNSESQENSQFLSPTGKLKKNWFLRSFNRELPKKNQFLCFPELRSSDPQIQRSPDAPILRSSDPQTLGSQDPQILRPSHPQILRSSDPQILGSSDRQILRSSHPWVLTSSDPQILKSSILRSSDPQLRSPDALKIY